MPFPSFWAWELVLKVAPFLNEAFVHSFKYFVSGVWLWLLWRLSFGLVRTKSLVDNIYCVEIYNLGDLRCLSYRQHIGLSEELNLSITGLLQICQSCLDIFKMV